MAGVKEGLQFCHIRDGTGRVHRASLEKSFDADQVDFLPGGAPSPLQHSERQGGNRKRFRAVSGIPVIVIRNTPGMGKLPLVLLKQSGTKNREVACTFS